MNVGITSKTTVLAVVISLALITLGCIAGSIVVFLLVDPSRADATTMGLVVTPMLTLAGTGIGALAMVLGSARSTLGVNESVPPMPPVAPVTVVNETVAVAPADLADQGTER